MRYVPLYYPDNSTEIDNGSPFISITYMKMSVKTEDYVPRNSKMSQEANKCPKKINGLEKLGMKIHTIHRDMEEFKHQKEYVGPSKARFWKLLK